MTQVPESQVQLNLLLHSFFFFPVVSCTAHTCLAYFFMKSRIYRGSQSSLATPRSLQQRMRALLLQASVAVGMPLGSKYSCSPRAMATNLE